jgi:hypothetical protein
VPIGPVILRYNYVSETRLTGSTPKPIKICDRSLVNEDDDNPDGLWARNVTVTEPSIIRGNQSKGLQAVSGYVGKSGPNVSLLILIVWLCTVETFEVNT